MPKQDDPQTEIDQTAQITVAVTSMQKPDYHLIVIHPFDDFKKGHHINDAETIAKVMKSRNSGNCHKIYPYPR